MPKIRNRVMILGFTICTKKKKKSYCNIWMFSQIKVFQPHNKTCPNTKLKSGLICGQNLQHQWPKVSARHGMNFPRSSLEECLNDSSKWVFFQPINNNCPDVCLVLNKGSTYNMTKKTSFGNYSVVLSHKLSHASISFKNSDRQG